jgi:soluble lytic murein transglycosylase-like protein
MPSPSHSLTVKRAAVNRAVTWSRTARRSLPFLLSGLTCLLGQPAFAQAGDAAQTASMARLDRHPPDDPVAAAIAEASRRFGLPTTWIRAVMRAESGGDPRAVSPTGAMGLMQIMPATWEELRVRHALGDDPFDSRDNILGGTGYLRDLLDRYGSPGFLAAYNAGPGRYEERRSGRPLPDETRGTCQ